jgi:hypothetical protein
MAQGLTGQQTIDLIKQLEELGMQSDRIDEILHVIETGGPRTTESLSPEGGSDSRLAIRMKMMDETDWRKKAALAALLISNDL